MRPGFLKNGIVALSSFVALASAPAVAQERPDSGRPVCFGVSFDRGCRFMLQYEVGYRVAAAGRAPRLDRARPRPRSDRSQILVGGGLIFSISPTTTLGAVYESGTGDGPGTRALGVRWGRQLRAENRLDLTGGVILFPLTGDSVVPRHRDTSPGVFAEAALHGSNALTLVVRDELYARRSGASGGNLLFAGARAEATPAVVLTLATAALYAIAYSLTGPNW